MLLNLADVINSILQASMFVLIANYCVKDEYKNNRGKLICAIVSIWISLQKLTSIIGNSSISIIITHWIPLLIVLIFYKKDKISVIISYSILYLICGISVLICSDIFFGYIKNRIPSEYVEIAMVACIYCVQYILSLVIFTNKDKLYKIYRTIRSRNISIVFLVILTIIIDFAVAFDKIINWKDNVLFKNSILFLFFLFLVMATIYFAIVEKRMREIDRLNQALEEKLKELNKVKHDYGAQISYLYGLHLMNQHERSGKLLKDIINGNNSIADAIEIYNDSDSIISIITKGIVDYGINVILDEHADFNDVEMTEYEVQKVLSNIVSNSVTAMGGKGVLTIRTYENFNYIVIKIQNDGPMIDSNIIDKIFEARFSTKANDKDEHGFGLAIVKETVESYKGSISVVSDVEKTEFTIKIPRKNKK